MADDPLSEAAAPPETLLPGGPSVGTEKNALPTYRERCQLFERQLSSASASSREQTTTTTIDMANLRALASAGLPERTRAVAWKLLLGYLPPRRAEWAGTLEERRRRYAEFCSAFVVAAPGGGDGGGSGGGGIGGGEDSSDHPLSQAADSRWDSYFRDSDLVAQIARDVARTHPGMHFFQEQGKKKKKKKKKE